VQDIGMSKHEDSAQSAPEGTPDVETDTAEEHKPTGLSPLAALSAVGAGIAAVGGAAAVAVKQTLLPEPEDAKAEQQDGTPVAEPAGEPPPTYAPAAAEPVPAGGAATEPAGLASASGVAAAAQDAADLERPSGAAPAIAPGPPPGVGIKGVTFVDAMQRCVHIRVTGCLLGCSMLPGRQKQHF
jgi:hypothetical protein